MSYPLGQNLELSLFSQDGHSPLIQDFFQGRTGLVRSSAKEGTFLTVLCFTNRCGSTYLSSLLSSVGLAGPPLDRNYEFLNIDKVACICESNGIGSLSEYVDFLISAYSSSSNSLLLKASAGQLSLLLRSGVLDAFRGRVEFILLYRSNVIAQAVSHSIAHQTDVWTSMHSGRDGSRLTLDVNRIRGIIVDVSTNNSIFSILFSAFRIRPKRIEYEALMADEKRVMAELLESFPRQHILTGRNQLPVSRQLGRINHIWEARVRAELREALA